MKSLNRIESAGLWHDPSGIPAFAMKDSGHAAPGGFAHPTSLPHISCLFFRSVPSVSVVNN
jgi:hypothetical protein